MTAARHEPSLPYLPGLDGLRAVSVLLVMLYHAELAWLPGGFLALDVFFVVSGYLITSLLCAEVERSADIDLWAFWKRRARRLLPALFALIAVVIAYAAFRLPDALWSLRQEVAAGLTYCTNWYLIFAHQSYFDQLARPSLLRHLWSLAVEEQFYVVWPLLFGGVLVRLSKGTAAWALSLAALASACWMAILFVPGQDPSRVYYGSDTRAQALLLGAALAFVLTPRRLAAGLGHGRARVADLCGLLGLTVLLAESVWINDGDSFPYLGGFALTDVCALAMIVASVLPGARVCGTLFGSPVLRWVGRRSYGLYLWHWPVFMLTRPGLDVSIDGPVLLAVRLLASFLIAELSFHGLEEPIRRGALARFMGRLRADADAGARLRARGVCVALALGCVALGTSLWTATRPADLALAWGLDGEPSQLAQVSEPHRTQRAPVAASVPGAVAAPIVPGAKAAVAPADAPSPSRSHGQKASATAPRAAAKGSLPERAGRAAVLCFGDSVMLGAARALRQTLGDVEIDARVGRRASEAVRALAERRAAGLLSNTVVVHIGNNGWLTEADFEGMVRQLEGVPRVLFVTNRVVRRWQNPNNEVILQGAKRHGRLTIVNWPELSADKRAWFRSDGCHLTNTGAAAYATLVRDLAAR